MPEYLLSDDCKLALVQARFEALRLGTRILDAGHIVLGVSKTLGPAPFVRLFPSTEPFEALCRAFHAVPEPAPPNAEDIEYAEDAREAIAGGMYLAAASGPGTEMTPLHLLLGVFRPVHPEHQLPVPPSAATERLREAGVTVETLLARITEAARPDP